MLSPNEIQALSLADAECIKLVESIGFSSVPTLQKIVAGIRAHLKKVLAGAKDAEAEHNAGVPAALARIDAETGAVAISEAGTIALHEFHTARGTVGRRDGLINIDGVLFNDRALGLKPGQYPVGDCDVKACQDYARQRQAEAKLRDNRSPNPDDCVSVTARGRQLVDAAPEPPRFMLLQDAMENFDCPATVEGHCIGAQCPAFARRQAALGDSGENTTRNVELVCTWGNSIQTIGVIEEMALEAAGRICPLVEVEGGAA